MFDFLTPSVAGQASLKQCQWKRQPTPKNLQLRNIYFVGATEVNIKVGIFLRFQRQLKMWVLGLSSFNLCAKHFFIKRYLLYITKHFTPLYFTLSRATCKDCPLPIQFSKKRKFNNTTNFCSDILKIQLLPQEITYNTERLILNFQLRLAHHW